MEHINHRSIKLNDRVLWIDGDSSITPTEVTNRLMSGKSMAGLFVTELTRDLEQFNRNFPKDKQLHIKEETNPLKFDWLIPEEYKTLDVKGYLLNKLSDQDNSDSETLVKYQRVMMEYDLFVQYNHIEMLQATIYIINTLIEHSVAWGIGRGSSTSSYILFLIGIHDVDSILYDLDIKDFLHD